MGTRCSLSLDIMVTGRVVQLTAEHIPYLATRLRSYGAYSLQTRAILRLLQTGINPAPFQIFAAGTEGVDLVAVTVMRPTPDFSVLDVCGLENSACRRQLTSLLRSPELAHLWRGPLRVEAVAEGLGPVFSAAAAHNGLRRVVSDNETQRLFTRTEGLACPPCQERPGLAVRPLQPHHLDKVRNKWAHSDSQPEMEAVLAGSQAAGLAIGVFLTEPSEAEPGSSLDDPVSWALVNSYGAQGFGYTEEAHRGHGLQSLVLKELIRRCIQQDLPVFGHTLDTNIAQSKNLVRLGYVKEHATHWLSLEPSDR